MVTSMRSFFIFVWLCQTQRSQSEECGYAMINNLPHLLNLCHGRRNADGSMSSDILSCNANGDGVELRFWRNAAECNAATSPPETIHPSSTQFDCSAQPCASYVAIKSYTSNACVAGTHILNDNAAASSNVGGVNNNSSSSNSNGNSNSPFEMTTLRTHACFNSSTAPYSQMITCTDIAYTIHSYSDAFCTKPVSSDVIEESDCKEVWFCSDTESPAPGTSAWNVSTSQSPVIPGGLQSTEYFTTTNTAAAGKCNFVSTIGVDMPTSQCMAITSTESQIYECITDALGASQIQWSYFGDSAECDSQQPTWTYQYPSNLMRDWRCDAEICVDDEYMRLTTYKTVDCASDLDVDIDIEVAIEYESDLYLVNRCMQTVDGEAVIYECVNNDNTQGLEGGYSVAYFMDAACQQPQNRSVFFQEKDCLNGEYQQHMTFCGGVNNLTSGAIAGNSTSGTASEEPILDCNYFINDHADPLGLIYEPLNECMPTQQGNAVYSKLYRCSADFSAIEEVVFDGRECASQQMTSIRPRPEITEFYCGSPFDCHAINITRTSSVGSVETLFNYDAVLIGKQYTNDTCMERNDEFWYLQPIIIDACWRMEQTGLYAKMSCDANGFVYHSLYSNADCSADSLAFDQRFEAFDCIFGKLFELVYCPRWNQTQGSSSSTTTTTTTTATTTTTSSSTAVTGDDTTHAPLSTTGETYSDFNTTNVPLIVSTDTSSAQTTVMETNPSDTMHDMFTSEDEQGWNKGDDPECVNVFGGKDAGGISCKVWEDIIWALIVLLAGISACFCCWCWWSADTQPLRKQVSLSLSRRRSSKLSIANGNDNSDIQQIVVEQLHKGLHVNAGKSSVSSKELEDEDEDEDDAGAVAGTEDDAKDEEDHVDLVIQGVEEDADDEKLSEDDPLDI